MTTIIGKEVIVRDLKHKHILVGGICIDSDDKNRSKRVRLTTGEHSGEVLMRNEYEVLEFIGKGETTKTLSTVWTS